MTIHEQITNGLKSGFEEFKSLFSANPTGATAEQFFTLTAKCAGLEKTLAAKDQEIVTLKSEHAIALKAKDESVEQLANVKAAAIVAKAGHTAIKEEGQADPQGKGEKGGEPETVEALWAAHGKLTDQKAKSEFYAAHPAMHPQPR